MSTDRMLRSGPAAEVAKSPSQKPEDARQGSLEFDARETRAQETRADETHAEREINRLAHENALLRARLARAGSSTEIEHPVYPADDGHGRNSKADPIAQLAASYAAQVSQLSSIQTDQPDDQDAAAVNAGIEMIAEEADALVAAVIKDAEDHGLEASGPWLKIPLLEVQAFEAPTSDPAADEADALRDRELNA